MTRKEYSVALRKETQVHYNCAQSVLIPFAQDMGITEEQAYALGQNFGGGMGCGSICGTITGILMVMGGLHLPVDKRTQLLREFRQAHGHLECGLLLKDAADRGEAKQCHCDRMVAWCMDWICRESGLK